MNRFGRPTAIVTSDSSGLLRGSVRSPDGFAVDKALEKCSKTLERFGGHAAAAGFTVKPENLAKLHTNLNSISSACPNHYRVQV